MKAYTLHPSSENAFLYMCRQISLGKSIDNEFVSSVLNSMSLVDEDNYWKGAICYYILSDEKNAEYYFNLCSGNFDWYE